MPAGLLSSGQASTGRLPPLFDAAPPALPLLLSGTALPAPTLIEAMDRAASPLKVRYTELLGALDRREAAALAEVQSVWRQAARAYRAGRMEEAGAAMMRWLEAIECHRAAEREWTEISVRLLLEEWRLVREELGELEGMVGLHVPGHGQS